MTTLAELKTQVRQFSDQPSTDFISDSEITTYINNAIRSVYNHINNQNQDYFISQAALTVTSGTATLPADFKLLRSISDESDRPLERHTTQKHFRQFPHLTCSGTSNYTYNLIGNTLDLRPAVSTTVNVLYTPRHTNLSSDSDVLDNRLEPFLELITVTAVEKILIKEESSTYELLLLKRDLKRELEAIVSQRDRTSNNKVKNVRYNRGYYGRWRR